MSHAEVVLRFEVLGAIFYAAGVLGSLGYACAENTGPQDRDFLGSEPLMAWRFLWSVVWPVRLAVLSVRFVWSAFRGFVGLARWAARRGRPSVPRARVVR